MATAATAGRYQVRSSSVCASASRAEYYHSDRSFKHNGGGLVLVHLCSKYNRSDAAEHVPARPMTDRIQANSAKAMNAHVAALIAAMLYVLV